MPDLLLQGLRLILGDQVIEYPRKDCLYQGVIGLAICPENQLCPNWFPDDQQQIDRSNINSKLKNNYFDLICADIRAIAQFQNEISTYTGPMVFIDGEDQPVKLKLDRVLLFSREGTDPNLSKPLPMALPKKVMQMIQRKHGEAKNYDIGFLGSLPNPEDKRRDWLEQLENTGLRCLFSSHQMATPDQQNPEGRFSREAYYQKLNQCKIVINLKGMGWDTFRYWENQAISAIHLSQRLPLHIPNPFEESSALQYFSTSAELLSLIDKNLNHDELDKRIEHLEKFHLTHHRARYFIDECIKAFNLQP